MRVIWTQGAIDDLTEIRRFLARSSRENAARVATRIRAAVKHLREHPEMGRDLDRVGVRELVINGTPYIVGYRVLEDCVELLRVRHGAQNS